MNRDIKNQFVNRNSFLEINIYGLMSFFGESTKSKLILLKCVIFSNTNKEKTKTPSITDPITAWKRPRGTVTHNPCHYLKHTSGNVRKINCVGLPLTSFPLFEKEKCICKCILQIICKIQDNRLCFLQFLCGNK